jgi:hypothetical protein
MRQKTARHKDRAERTIKDIRGQTRKRYSAEEEKRIVLAEQLARRHRAKPVLQLVEGVPRGRQEAAGR